MCIILEQLLLNIFFNHKYFCMELRIQNQINKCQKFMSDQSQTNYECIHKYPGSLQKIKLIAQRAFWTDVDKYLNSYYYPYKIKIEDEFFLCQEQQNLKRFYDRYQHSNKMQLLTSYYQYHIEMPRTFINRVSQIMEANYDAKRDLQYVRVTNQLKKQKNFAQEWENQNSTYERAENDSYQNQKQFSSFNLLDDLTLSQKSMVYNEPSQADNSEDIRTTLIRMKLALSNTESLDLPSNQLFYQPKKTPRQKSKNVVFGFVNKQNGYDKNSTDSELKVVSKSILVSKKMMKGVYFTNEQAAENDRYVKMSFIKKMIQKMDQNQTITPQGQLFQKQQVNNSKSTCSKSNYKIQVHNSQNPTMKKYQNSKHSSISNNKMFNNLIEMKKRVK